MKLPVFVAGEGESLLMIHGIISDGSFFHNIAEELKDTYQVIGYDRRGYGHAEKPADDSYTVEAQAEDAAEVIRTYGKAPVWILGNSAGGLIAIELCLKHPELVRGLLLLEPSLAYDEESIALLRAWNEELNGFVQAKRIKRALPAFSRVIGQAETGKSASTLEEMKQTYANLTNFMHGELNEVQHYAPPVDELQQIQQPIRVIITENGRNSIFATSSRHGAEILGWKCCSVPGYHNALKDEAAAAAICIRTQLEEMKGE